MSLHRRLHVSAADAPISTALRVSRPGDALERAADRMADHAMQVLRNDAAEITQAPERGGVRAVHESARPLLHSLRDDGAPLPADERPRLERALGHDLSHVRVHTGTHAERSARALRATAYAIGPHVVFARAAYAPGSGGGRRLLLHELAHTLQPAGADSLLRTAAAGEYVGDGEKEEEQKKPEIVGDEEDSAVLRQPDPALENAAPPAGDTVAAPAPPGVEASPTEADTQAGPGTQAHPMKAGGTAKPTLGLSPGASLTRGQSLSATVAFNPAAGEKLDVTGWSYETSEHGTVTRPTTEAGFQTKWEGVMAQTGKLKLSYRITPAGGTQGSEESVESAITVSDRTGDPWQSTIEEEKEGALKGKPSPPTVFSDLGLHNTNAKPLPSPTSSPVKGGPNAGMAFVGGLKAGKFLSSPFVHPDLKNEKSQFFKFHQTATRLYLNSQPKRKLIPTADYSKLDLTSGVKFDVPDWDAFYKKHKVYKLEITWGGKTVVLKDAWWALSKNARDASVNITDWPAIRAALGAGPDDNLPAPTVTSAGGWQGYNLQPSASILTGTRSHEYVHGTHSHRANYQKMMRALDPAREIEHTVSAVGDTPDFPAKVMEFWNEIVEPNHEIVDEKESAKKKEFVAESGKTMAGVNTDPDSGARLGAVWHITADDAMS